MADTLTFGKQPLLYCTCGGIPMESTAKKCLMTGINDTVAAGEGQLTTHPFLPGCTIGAAQIVTMHADTDDDSFPAVICGDPSEIETVPIEMPEGTLVQATSLEFMAWGR